MKTITKFSIFVISLLALSWLEFGCAKVISNEPGGNNSAAFGKPMIVGRIQSNDVIESSGIAASKCQPGVYWTHNDSGDAPNIYALNDKGESLGTFRVSNAYNDDWEDIAEYKDASGKCYVYLADIGDNKLRRPVRTIFRVAEPIVSDATRRSNSKAPVPTEAAVVLNFRYPEAERNAEAMMVDPGSGNIYVLTKSIEHPSEVFKLMGNFGNADIVTAQKVADLAVPNVPNGQVTGGDISSDGKRVVLCDYTWAYELELPVNAKKFDEIWAVKPDRIDLGKLQQTEAIGYTADGSAILVTSESAHPPLVMVRRNQ